MNDETNDANEIMIHNIERKIIIFRLALNVYEQSDNGGTINNTADERESNSTSIVHLA